MWEIEDTVTSKLRFKYSNPIKKRVKKSLYFRAIVFSLQSVIVFWCERNMSLDLLSHKCIF